MWVLSMRLRVLRERLGTGVETGEQKKQAQAPSPPLQVSGWQDSPPVHAVCDVAQHRECLQRDLKFHQLCLLLQLLGGTWCSGLGGGALSLALANPREPQPTFIGVLYWDSSSSGEPPWPLRATNIVSLRWQ